MGNINDYISIIQSGLILNTNQKLLNTEGDYSQFQKGWHYGHVVRI